MTSSSSLHGQRDEDGPEDLLARDAPGLLDAGEHGRPQLVAGAARRPAAPPVSAVAPWSSASREVAADAVVLRAGDDRADVGALVERVADDQLARAARRAWR